MDTAVLTTTPLTFDEQLTLLGELESVLQIGGYGKMSLDTELSLSDVSETMLLTLYARAMEAQAYFGG